MLEIKDLVVSYGAVEAVRGVTLTAAPGAITAIVGANGAGKSSLLRAITGLAPIKGGQVLLDGILYGTNSQGLVAGDFLTGKLRWKTEDGPGSVLYADGRLYVHGESGEVFLVDAKPDAYREKGRFTPANPPKHTRNREMAWAYPVVADGRLLIRDLGTLWCYDIRGK